MNTNTLPLEAETRVLIDRSLENLGWKFNGKDKNVFFEQPKTESERKKLNGKRPDYVLYSKESDKPLIVIEAKKRGLVLMLHWNKVLAMRGLLKHHLFLQQTVCFVKLFIQLQIVPRY